jgi:hypothetical protein
MDRGIRDRLPTNFPEELLDAAYSLQALQVNEVAWKYEAHVMRNEL